jgi:hypothetical protein
LGFKTKKDGTVYNDNKKEHGKSDDSPNSNDGSDGHERQEIDQEQARVDHEKILDHEYDRFLQGINEFGSGDIAEAVALADLVGMNGMELSDLIRDQTDQMEMDMADADINGILYEHILQMARNEISEVIDYDFLNDNESGGPEISVAPNYMATSFDWSTEAQEELQDKINSASSEEKQRLKNDKYTKVFLDYTDIEV